MSSTGQQASTTMTTDHSGTPAQAAAWAFMTGCVRRGITASAASVPPEGQLSTVRGLWADVAHAAITAQGPQPGTRDVAECLERIGVLAGALFEITKAYPPGYTAHDTAQAALEHSAFIRDSGEPEARR